MRSMRDIKKSIAKAKIQTSSQANQFVFDDLLSKLDETGNETPAINWSDKRRIFMRSSITKIATAAVVIIAALICINQFGDSSAGLAWAEVAKQFESVPFFSLTIYFSENSSASGNKVELWKSDDSRVRIHEGDKVVFSRSVNGENKIVAFDRSTGQPTAINQDGMVLCLINQLCRDGRFSLETIITSLSSDNMVLTPVNQPETPASKEIVMFEVKNTETTEELLIWALRQSKLPIQLHFSDPRNGEFSDFIFNYSQKKNSSFFDPNAFTDTFSGNVS